jgi:hypothetical protein
MADTRRTKAEILALFADNAIGSISAQDLRDSIVTMMGGYAVLRKAGAGVAFAVTATPQKLTTFNGLGAFNGLIADHTTDDITTDIGGTYSIIFDISFSGTALKTFFFNFYIDGVPQSEAAQRKLGTGGDIGSTGMSAIITLTAGQVVTIYVSSPDGGNSITVADSQLNMHQIA